MTGNHLTTPSRLRAALTERSAERREHRRLADELSTYRTPAEIADLQAAIARSTDPDAAVIREMLSRPRVA